MIRSITILSLAAVVLCGCKPTERTALRKKLNKITETEAPATVPAEPLATPTPDPAAPVAEPEPLEPSGSLMLVHATLQEYDPMQPWQKQSPRQSRAFGVYMGEGRVLTIGRVVREATYVELLLPDVSRTVPARVLRYDEDMNLALLTVAHEEDASIFDTRTPLPLGEPLNRGDKATYAGLINGVEPVHVDMVAENVSGDNVPLMVMRAARPLPEGQTTGMPIVRDDKLSALGTAYKKQEQLMQVVNAELIQRFLTQEKPGVPVVGLKLTPLDDQVFRKYLKLDAAANGMYISKVLPGSAAEAAGVKEGDVLTAVEGMPVDNLGRCNHPRYGLHHVVVLMRGMKDAGQEIMLGISRAGEAMQIAVKLDRTAEEKAVFRQQQVGRQPRYIMWGGLLFQPLTSTYMNEVRTRSNGLLPLELQVLLDEETALREKGCTEAIGLTFVLPTAATQGYEELRFSRLVAVNGKPVNCFAELPALLDEQTENGIVRLEFNKPPYTIYVDRVAADAVNAQLQQSSIPNLRVVE